MASASTSIIVMMIEQESFLYSQILVIAGVYTNKIKYFKLKSVMLIRGEKNLTQNGKDTRRSQKVIYTFSDPGKRR